MWITPPMTMSNVPKALALGSLLALAPLWAAAEGIAFPGAMGFGAEAVGWKGGAITRVTTLKDDGPGSLRDCAEADVPRVCVFDVSGTISLNSDIRVRPNVYIAGQTAPGDGVQIRLGDGTSTPVVVKNSNDVVIRFLKIRPGAPEVENAGVDAITLENATRVYLDHLSLGFATDETLNIHASQGLTADITVANSLLAFSLDRSTHPKGRHSKGALICSMDRGADGCGRVTLMRNVFAHHRDRNPDVKATDTGPVEVLNNVFYDPISQFGEYYNLYGLTRIAHIGNLTVPGPSTNWKTPVAVELYLLGNGEIELEARDNLALRRCKSDRNGTVLGPVARANRSPAPILSANRPLLEVGDLLKTLLPIVGDRLPDGGHRDALDTRAVADIRDCTGKVIDTAAEVGGWPEIAASPPPADTDGDGLPDMFESGRPGLDPARADDPWTQDPETGLSYAETWLAELAGDL
ncbi:polysaccharide lyase family 1 protein [Palleronia rufa]